MMTPLPTPPPLNFDEVLWWYGVSLRTRPPYVVVGWYDPPVGERRRGVLALTSNELHAHIIRREVRRHGHATVERTEFHPGGATFHIRQYFEGLRRR